MSIQPVGNDDEPGWDHFLQKYEHRMSPGGQDAFHDWLKMRKIDIDTATLSELEDALTNWNEEKQGASLCYDEDEEDWRST